MSEPTFEEWAIDCPQWAKDLMSKDVPLVVGLPVFDVHHVGHDGRAFGIVRALPAGGRIVVEYTTGEILGGPVAHYVPDLTDEVGQAHYQNWRKSHG